MSLNLVSPGVKVREVDLTIGRVDAANDQVGAIAGPFVKGPVDVPILIETEQDLLATFRKTSINRCTVRLLDECIIVSLIRRYIKSN